MSSKMESQMSEQEPSEQDDLIYDLANNSQLSTLQQNQPTEIFPMAEHIP